MATTAPAPAPTQAPAQQPATKEYAMGEGSTPDAKQPEPLAHVKDVK